MSLLREIQDAAIDSKVELAVLLRKCKVLAFRLGNSEFKQWVENELSGYSNIEDLPDYRILRVYSKGHFSGPFQSGLRNADIPLSCIPKEFHKTISHSYLTQPIAALESLVKSNKEDILREAWNPDLVAYVGQNIYENMNCLQAWKVIPVSRIIAVLDAVRNRILNFALEIETEVPDAGETSINSESLPQDKVQQIFNTYIMGNAQNVAAGSTNVKQEATSNINNDKLFECLLDALLKSNEDQKIVSELVAVVEEMKNAQNTPRFKESYLRFISLLADHMQVFGPIIAPFLSKLTALIS